MMEFGSALWFVLATRPIGNAEGSLPTATRPSLLFCRSGLTELSHELPGVTSFGSDSGMVRVAVAKPPSDETRFQICAILSGLKADIDSCRHSLVDDGYCDLSISQTDFIAKFQILLKQFVEGNIEVLNEIRSGRLTPAVLYAEDGEVEVLVQHVNGDRFSSTIPHDGPIRTWIVENGVATQIQAS